MRTSTVTAEATTAPPRSTGWARWWRCRTELGFACGVLAIAGFMTYQIVHMEVPEGVGTPGPQFVPGLVALFLCFTGGLLAINVIRNPRHTEATSTMGQLSTDMLTDLAAIDDAGLIAMDRGAASTRPSDQSSAESEWDEMAGACSDLGPRSTAPAATSGSGYIPVDYRTTGLVLGGLVLFALLMEPIGWLITASALFWLISYALGSKRQLFDIAVSVIVASVIQIAFSIGLGLALPSGILEGVLPWSS